MSDDWNLKGRKYHLDHPLEDPENYDIYYKGTINIIREKLIEDIKELENSDSEYIPYIFECVLEIINKRFGVKK